jgi:DNA polymerase-3 subunit gamma/tau
LKSISFDLALEELARLIHKISTYQIIPDNFDNSTLNEEIRKLSSLFSSESLQLNYQITINGRKDLHLAPDPITGFNMTLLRMLAFYPSTDQIGEANPKKKIETKVEIKKIDNLNNKKSLQINNSNENFSGDWPNLVGNLKIGLAKSLAQECSLLNYEDQIFNLTLDKKFQHLNQDSYINTLQEALTNYFKIKITVIISLGDNLQTPSLGKKLKNEQLMKTTESAIMNDSFVKELIDDFGAEVISSSLKPTIKKEN